MFNKLKKFILLIFAVILPVTVFLTACGATPTNEVRGVHFISETYDPETGFAVFEVDKDVPTKLEYKVNPSSWSGYVVTYTTPQDTAENKVRYTLIGGVITVSSLAFEQIQVRIHINGQSDTCFIRLKEYPDRVYTDQSSVKINAFGVYTICPIGEFTQKDGTKIQRPISDREFNFKVESNDPTIISVPNSTRLTVCSVRRNIASAAVNVTLCDTTGKSKGMSFAVEFSVIQNAKDGYLIVDGYNKFVENGDEITISLSDLAVDGETGKKLLGYQLFVSSDSNIFLEPETECSTTNTRYISVNNTENVLEIDFDSNLTVTVNVWTPLIDEAGNAFAVIFKLNLKP